MKLIRFGEAGKERPGVLLGDDSRLDVSDFVPDYDEVFFARGTVSLTNGVAEPCRLIHNFPRRALCSGAFALEDFSDPPMASVCRNGDLVSKD